MTEVKNAAERAGRALNLEYRLADRNLGMSDAPALAPPAKARLASAVWLTSHHFHVPACSICILQRQGRVVGAVPYVSDGHMVVEDKGPGGLFGEDGGLHDIIRVTRTAKRRSDHRRGNEWERMVGWMERCAGPAAGYASIKTPAGIPARITQA